MEATLFLDESGDFRSPYSPFRLMGGPLVWAPPDCLNTLCRVVCDLMQWPVIPHAIDFLNPVLVERSLALASDRPALLNLIHAREVNEPSLEPDSAWVTNRNWSREVRSLAVPARNDARGRDAAFRLARQSPLRNVGELWLQEFRRQTVTQMTTWCQQNGGAHFLVANVHNDLRGDVTPGAYETAFASVIGLAVRLAAKRGAGVLHVCVDDGNVVRREAEQELSKQCEGACLAAGSVETGRYSEMHSGVHVADVLISWVRSNTSSALAKPAGLGLCARVVSSGLREDDPQECLLREFAEP
jgi:hypothetical protein